MTKTPPNLVHNHIAIMAIDPGLHTGIAQGVFPCLPDVVGKMLVKDILKEGLFMSAKEIVEDEKKAGWEIGAAIEIVRAWKQFKKETGNWKSAGHLIKYALVMESWQVRLPMRTANRVVMSPARIAAAVEGLLASPLSSREQATDNDSWESVKYQSPADAKQYATDARLKAWGLWVVGSDHARDANRHMTLALLNETK